MEKVAIASGKTYAAAGLILQSLYKPKKEKTLEEILRV